MASSCIAHRTPTTRNSERVESEAMVGQLLFGASVLAASRCEPRAVRTRAKAGPP